MVVTIRFPSPATKGLMGKAFGHLPELTALANRKKKSIGMALHLQRRDWYRMTGSKTIELNLMGKPMIICSDPDIYKEILGPKQEAFTNSGVFKQVFGYFFPTSAIVVDGDQWQRIRKVMQRAISKQSLNPVVSVMCQSADILFSHAKLNELQTSDILARIVFDGFHRVMYGWDPKSILGSADSVKILQACNAITLLIGQRLTAPVPILWSLPTRANRDGDAARAHLNHFIVSFISARRAELKRASSAQPAASLLDAMILAAEAGEEGGLTDRELQDQIATLFFGAYESTSHTLHFILHYLASYPAEQEVVRAAVRARFPSRADLAHAPLEEVEAIGPLGHFIDEVHCIDCPPPPSPTCPNSFPFPSPSPTSTPPPKVCGGSHCQC